MIAVQDEYKFPTGYTQYHIYKFRPRFYLDVYENESHNSLILKLTKIRKIRIAMKGVSFKTGILLNIHTTKEKWIYSFAILDLKEVLAVLYQHFHSYFDLETLFHLADRKEIHTLKYPKGRMTARAHYPIYLEVIR